MSFCRLKRGLSPSRVLISLPVSRSCPRWLKAPMRLRAGSDILVLVWGVLVVGEIEDGQFQVGQVINVLKIVIIEQQYFQVGGFDEELSYVVSDGGDIDLIEGKFYYFLNRAFLFDAVTNFLQDFTAHYELKYKYWGEGISQVGVWLEEYIYL